PRGRPSCACSASRNAPRPLTNPTPVAQTGAPMNMPSEPSTTNEEEAAPISGVDPFAKTHPADDLERSWFAQPETKRPSRPPSSTAAPPAIGDTEADGWFR